MPYMVGLTLLGEPETVDLAASCFAERGDTAAAEILYTVTEARLTRLPTLTRRQVKTVLHSAKTTRRRRWWRPDLEATTVAVWVAGQLAEATDHGYDEAPIWWRDPKPGGVEPIRRRWWIPRRLDRQLRILTYLGRSLSRPLTDPADLAAVTDTEYAAALTEAGYPITPTGDPA